MDDNQKKQKEWQELLKRRCCFALSKAAIMTLLTQKQEVLVMSYKLDLPDDHQIISVGFDCIKDCFIVTVVSKEFNIVPDGGESRMIEISYEIIKVKVHRPKKR
jgi:hypothetical protein